MHLECCVTHLFPAYAALNTILLLPRELPRTSNGIDTTGLVILYEFNLKCIGPFDFGFKYCGYK